MPNCQPINRGLSIIAIVRLLQTANIQIIYDVIAIRNAAQSSTDEGFKPLSVS
jgi:hypothetical protein